MLDFGFYNMDCMEGMKEFPDKYFDLAVCDPPYGICYDTKARQNAGKKSSGAAAPKRFYHASGWDVRPQKEYFDELMRVSKNQIIWGGIILQIFCHHQRGSLCGISVVKT